MHLPEKFQKEMEILLGDEYQAFKESYDRQPETTDIRTKPVHRRKIRIIMRDCIICRNRVR